MRARVIAYYLPQFHPIPENDEYWGKGFTEWTNVAMAKPLFRGHYQPQLPADLGFYDLRVPETRIAQAELAKEAGIEGFCYWHYWFGNGRQVLERPFQEVLASGEPDFPFCLGWANHSWTTKTWVKGKSFGDDKVIIEQLYPGLDDYEQHFYSVLDAFKDPRYIKVEGKPLFVVFDPDAIPDSKLYLDTWRSLAKSNGLKDIYFVARCEALPSIANNLGKSVDGLILQRYQSILQKGYDGVNSVTLKYAQLKQAGVIRKGISATLRKVTKGAFLERYKYKSVMEHSFTPEDYLDSIYPQLIPRRDRSPRSGRRAIVLYDSKPEHFAEAAENAVRCVEGRDFDHRLIFLNAWNEWGEGAYMEPDLRFGRGYIDSLRGVLG